jgi:hypothetical protein
MLAVQPGAAWFSSLLMISKAWNLQLIFYIDLRNPKLNLNATMKKYAVEIKWGILFTVVMLLWMAFERLMGWHDAHIDKHPIYTNLFAIPATVMYVLALLDKRKRDYGGKMTWKQGFVAGLLVSVVVMILSPLAQWITHFMITPDYFTNVIGYTVETQSMTREQAEKYFSFGNYVWQSALAALVMGAVTSAIVAIFTRKK